MNKQSILYVPRKKPNARFRLVCFPYAGGSATAYFSWINNLHQDVEVVLIQLPGRGMRIAEAPHTTMVALVSDIYLALSELPSKPFIFFGHSMGARVAYEVTLMLYKHQRALPIHVIASGSPAPFVTSKKPPTYHLPDIEFVDHLRELKGTPEEILENQDLMQLTLPVLRVDFKIVETYLNPLKIKLPTRISIFSGKRDDIDFEDVEAWAQVFESPQGSCWFEGGHFFIHENNALVIEQLNHIIDFHVNKESVAEGCEFATSNLF